MSHSSKIKVLIAQPEAEIRARLRRQFTGLEDVVVMGETDCGEAVLAFCKDPAVGRSPAPSDQALPHVVTLQISNGTTDLPHEL